MILLHSDIDPEILSQGRAPDSSDCVLVFAHKSMRHQRNMTQAAMFFPDCVSINSSLALEFLDVVL